MLLEARLLDFRQKDVKEGCMRKTHGADDFISPGQMGDHCNISVLDKDCPTGGQFYEDFERFFNFRGRRRPAGNL